MSTEWKPGNVGMTAHGTVALCQQSRRFIDTNGAPWSDGKFGDNLRPLAVIDPEDREQIERLLAAIPMMGQPTHGEMQAALREFANPTPPKPDEPLGLGAVVEAIHDNRFVRVGAAGWVHEQDFAGEPCDWQDVAAVRVIWGGVS